MADGGKGKGEKAKVSAQCRLVREGPDRWHVSRELREGRSQPYGARRGAWQQGKQQRPRGRSRPGQFWSSKERLDWSERGIGGGQSQSDGIWSRRAFGALVRALTFTLRERRSQGEFLSTEE